MTAQILPNNQIPETTQPLYSISEAAKLLGVSPSTLRRWEEEGRLVPVRTTGGNHRRYSQEDVKRLLTSFRQETDPRRAYGTKVLVEIPPHPLGVDGRLPPKIPVRTLEEIRQPFRPPHRRQLLHRFADLSLLLLFLALLYGIVTPLTQKRLGRAFSGPLQNLIYSTVKIVSPQKAELIKPGIANPIVDVNETFEYVEMTDQEGKVATGLRAKLTLIGSEMITQTLRVVKDGIFNTTRFLGTLFFGEGKKYFITPLADAFLRSLTLSDKATIPKLEASSIKAGEIQADSIDANLDWKNLTNRPSIISSVDGVTNDGGNIDLIAGANITIVPNDLTNTVTFSSTGGGGGGDADTLDSLDSSQFLRSDTSDSFTSGTLTFNAGTTLNLSSAILTLANNQIGWAKVSKSGSSLADLETRSILDTTGTLTVARGGTGATTLTGMLKGNGSSAFTAVTGTVNYATYWSDPNTIAAEQYLAVSRGGTGAGTLNDLIALGTHTTGDYVATITAGGGLTGDASGEGSTPTLAVGAGTNIIVNANDVATVMNPTFTTSVTSPTFRNVGNITLDAINAGADSTVYLLNSNATYVADLNVEGDITAGGSISGGSVSFTNLTVTGWSDLQGDVYDTTGNLTLADTVDISGNLAVSGVGTHTFAGTLDPTNVAAYTLTGTITGNNQDILNLNNVTGVTSSWSTSVTSPLYTGTGAVTLSSGGTNTLTIDTGGAAALNIGTTNQNALTLGRATINTTINGANIILGAQADATTEAVRADRSLTFTQDTNVTISNSGVAQNLTADRSWTLGWNGQLAVGRGGTGASTLTQYGVLYGNTTSAIGATAAGATDQVLLGNTSAAPSWGTVGGAAITNNSLDFVDFEDTLDLDADLTLNQSTYTWTQNFTGAATTGFTYNANSLTSGKGIYITSTSTAGLTGNLAEVVLSGSNAANTGNVLRVAQTGTLSAAVPLMVTNLGTGLSFRVNDETGDADTTPFVIDGGGNVGIGTTGPGAKLEITGNILLTKQAARSITVGGSTTSGVAGGSLTVEAGAGPSAGAAVGGSITLTAGRGSNDGFPACNNIACAGGDISITTGAGGINGGNSGNLTLVTGTIAANSGAITGSITIQTGTPPNNGFGSGANSGSVTIQSAPGASSTLSSGSGGISGAVILRSQAGGNGATSGNGGAAGALSIAGGAGGTTGTGTGGAGAGITIGAGAGGAPTGAGTSGAGGALTITAGSAGLGSAITGATGGAISLTAGNGTLALGGGAITLTSGTGGATGTGGALTLISGAGGSTSGNSGSLTLRSGSVTSGTAGSILFQTNGTNTRVTIDSGGNVGIGTTPGTRLDVRDAPAASTNVLTVYNTAAQASGDITIATLRSTATAGTQNIGDTGLYIWVNKDTVTPSVSLRAGGVQTTNLILQPDGGNVGIGTTGPDFKLDVSGDVRIESANNLYFGGTGAADNDVRLSRGAADRLDLASGDTLRLAGATATAYPGIELYNSDAGAANATQLQFYHDSASPASLDILGSLVFYGKNSVGTKTAYSTLQAKIDVPTSGSELGYLSINTPIEITKSVPTSLISDNYSYAKTVISNSHPADDVVLIGTYDTSGGFIAGGYGVGGGNFMGIKRAGAYYGEVGLMYDNWASTDCGLCVGGTGFRWYDGSIRVYGYGDLFAKFSDDGYIRLNNYTGLEWSSTTSADDAADVKLSRGAANRLDLASGDSFNVVSGNLIVDTNVLYVDSSTDRVGIGTTNPSQLLTLDSAGATRLAVKSGDNWNVVGMDPSDGAFIMWDAAYPLRFATSSSDGGTGWSEKMRIASDGNVGIGTASITAGYRLQIVGGALCVDDATSNCPASPTAGAIYVENSVGSGYVSAFDIAEDYSASEEVKAGEIVAIDQNNKETVKKSTQPYQSSLLGIVSTKPAIIMGENVALGKNLISEENPFKPYITLAGRTLTKVSTINGPIEVGDPITSSEIPGVGMKATKVGQIVGKALEPYDNPDPNAIGKIMVFVNLSWYDPGVLVDRGGDLAQVNATGTVTKIVAQTVEAEEGLFQKLTVLIEAVFEKITAKTAEIAEAVIQTLRVGELSAEKAEVKTLEVEALGTKGESSGSGVIPAGEGKVVIKSLAVTERSKIYVTFTTDYAPATRFWIGEKKVGENFVLELDAPVAADAKFDWWIVN